MRRNEDEKLIELVQRLRGHPKLRAVVSEMVKKMIEVYEKES